jgi:hypothetical protein
MFCFSSCGSARPTAGGASCQPATRHQRMAFWSHVGESLPLYGKCLYTSFAILSTFLDVIPNPLSPRRKTGGVTQYHQFIRNNEVLGLSSPGHRRSSRAPANRWQMDRNLCKANGHTDKGALSHAGTNSGTAVADRTRVSNPTKRARLKWYLRFHGATLGALMPITLGPLLGTARTDVGSGLSQPWLSLLKGEGRGIGPWLPLPSP